MLHLLSLTYCRTTDICPPMQRSLPKLAGKLSVLCLTNVSFSHSCVVGLVHLLNSSLKDLHLSDCILTSDEYDYLTTAIATSTLENFYFYADVMTKEMENSLARLLTLTKSLEVVSWHSSADCDVNAVAHVQTLVEAMAHSIVKKLRLPLQCKYAMADMPYPKDRVKFWFCNHWNFGLVSMLILSLQIPKCMNYVSTKSGEIILRAHAYRPDPDHLPLPGRGYDYDVFMKKEYYALLISVHVSGVSCHKLAICILLILLFRSA